MGDATAIFSIHDKKDYEIHEIVQQVYDALKEKGYNPVNQLVGYILSEDPTYITTYKNARATIHLADHGTGIFIGRDVGGVFGQDIAHQLIDRIIAFFL